MAYRHGLWCDVEKDSNQFGRDIKYDIVQVEQQNQTLTNEKAISIDLETFVMTVGLARRLDRLTDLQKSLQNEKGPFHPKQCDITNEEELVQVFKWIESDLGAVHILINNAGILGSGKVSEQPTEIFRRVFETNVIALCMATREAVTSMKAHKVAGQIVHINSIAGHGVPIFHPPEQASYPASKHAVTALTETLRQEMNHDKTGIKVTSISPGFVTNTDIFNNQGSRFEACNLAALELEDVADAVLYVLATPPRVQVHELTLKAVGEEF